MNLGEIFNHYGSDKESGHAYAQYYEKHLPLKVNKLLEIGCWRGQGIISFKEYYNNEGKFYAMDRFLEGHGLITIGELASKGINSLQGDHDDLMFLGKIKEQFSCIVEDGSHHWKSQIIVFKTLFEHNLESGGLYVIEDVFDEPYWGQGIIKTKEQNIKGLLSKFHTDKNISGDYITQEESNRIVPMIDEVFIYDNIIFIKKK